MIYIPTLHTFAMNNIFTGSHGNLRFRIVPKVEKNGGKEVDLDASAIEVEYWYGDLCYEKSTIEEKQVFPMCEEGRAALKSWLESKIQ